MFMVGFPFAQSGGHLSEDPPDGIFSTRCLFSKHRDDPPVFGGRGTEYKLKLYSVFGSIV